MRRKLSLALSITLIICFISPYATYGSAIKSESRVQLVSNVIKIETLDLSSGYIQGINDYSFMISDTLASTLIAKRVYPSQKDMFVDKIEFYCKSRNKAILPLKLFSLYVFTYEYWESASLSYEIAKKSKDYIYVVDYTSENYFTSYADKKNLAYCREAFSDSKTLGDYIDIPIKQQVKERVVYINNVPLKTQLEIIDGAYYIPVRDAFEMLGYSVEWVGKTSSIHLVKYKEVYIFPIKNGVYQSPTAKIILKDGKSYIFIVFFVKNMQKSYEVKKFENIYIY